MFQLVLFRGDVKCKSLQRRTSISVILPSDNIHFLNDAEEIVPQPYKTLYFLHGLYGSDDIVLANTSIQKFAEDNGIAIVIPCGENSFYVDHEKSHAYYGEYVGQERLDMRNLMHIMVNMLVRNFWILLETFFHCLTGVKILS